MDSVGNWSRTARATVSPPTPESKIPMGASAPVVVGMTGVRLVTGADVAQHRTAGEEQPGAGPAGAGQVPDDDAGGRVQGRLPHPEDRATGGQAGRDTAGAVLQDDDVGRRQAEPGRAGQVAL